MPYSSISSSGFRATTIRRRSSSMSDITLPSEFVSATSQGQHSRISSTQAHPEKKNPSPRPLLHLPRSAAVTTGNAAASSSSSSSGSPQAVPSISDSYLILDNDGFLQSPTELSSIDSPSSCYGDYDVTPKPRSPTEPNGSFLSFGASPIDSPVFPSSPYESSLYSAQPCDREEKQGRWSSMRPHPIIIPSEEIQGQHTQNDWRQVIDDILQADSPFPATPDH